MSNPFFINQGPYDILEILKLLNLNSNKFQKRNVHDVKDLLNASNNDLGSYLNSYRLFGKFDLAASQLFYVRRQRG